MTNARKRQLEHQRAKREAERKAAVRRRQLRSSAIGIVLIAAAALLFFVGLPKLRSHESATASSPSPTATKTSPKPTVDPTPTSFVTPGAASKLVACGAKAPAISPKPQFPYAPPAGVDASKTYDVTFDTSCGSFTVRLLPKEAPQAVSSFLFLVRQGFYDGLTFHRITQEGIFVIQGGDPTGAGAGGPGYQFEDEVPKDRTYKAGVLAMANAGPDTNGSQFFVIAKDSTLAPSYTIFGEVTSGLDVVQKIQALPINGGGSDGAPDKTVYVNKATVK
ncbi:MAG: peptidylprolyl isomerase [Actinomycetota bacterium]